MSRDTIIFFALVMVVTLVLLFLPQAFAFESKAKQLILLDYNTGDILETKNANIQMHPSSMSKLMTLYVMFDQIKQGKISPETTFKVSEKAWRKGGSKMFVRVDTDVSVNDLIHGIIVQSGNDACIVAAEGIAGTEEHFAQIMTATAKQLGLKNSHFVNATGWPDEQHLMSAEDLAILTKRLLSDFPEFYSLFAETEFEYNKIKQPNRNRLLHDSIGVDGLKTGHTDAGGYGIVLSAKDTTGRRLIAVVNGLDSEKTRLETGKDALIHGFNNFEIKQAIPTDQTLADIPLHYGRQPSVASGVDQALFISIPTSKTAPLTVEVEYLSPITAPITMGQEVGVVRIKHPNGSLRELPLVSKEAVEEKGLFGRAVHNLFEMVAPAS